MPYQTLRRPSKVLPHILFDETGRRDGRIDDHQMQASTRQEFSENTFQELRANFRGGFATTHAMRRDQPSCLLFSPYSATQLSNDPDELFVSSGCVLGHRIARSQREQGE